MAINDVSLTAGMRSNLVALQGTVDLLNRTQERLSTGKKVNTALDNPLNFFTAKALNSRAADLAGYKDGMSEAVQTIKAANNGISAIEGLLAQAKAVAATAKAGVAGGSGDYLVTIDLASVTNGQTITVGTAGTFTAVATDMQVTIAFDTATTGMTYGDEIKIGDITYTATAAGTSTDTATVHYFAITKGKANVDADINSLVVKLTADGIGVASTDAGLLNLSLASSSLAVTTDKGTGGAAGAISTDQVDLGAKEFMIGDADADTATNLAAKLVGANEATPVVDAYADGSQINLQTGTATITAGSVSVLTSAEEEFGLTELRVTADRASYAEQFKTILDQLNLLATDSGYKGINFLAAGNSLDVEFGSATTDKITLEGFDASAKTLLGKTSTYAKNAWATDAAIDSDIAGLTAATSTLKTETSRLSSGLSIINTRQDWVKGMVNTLTTGSDNLTLADMNEEGANMLMLQTRQTLGTTALSLSAQAAQSVLRLFA